MRRLRQEQRRGASRMTGVTTERRGAGRIYNLVVYLLSQVLSQATNVVRGLILPNLLGPTGYGVIATVNALDRYTPYVSAGSHYYVVNRLPVVDDAEARDTVLDTIFTFTLVTSLLGAVVVAVSALFQLESRGLVVAYGVATIALNPLSSGVWRLHSSLLRVDERIPLMMRLTNAQTLVSSVLIVVLTYVWGIPGTFSAQLLTALFVLALLRMASPYRFRLRWSWPHLRVVLGFSVPVFLVSGLLMTTVDTMEIFVVANRLGAAAVGIFAWGGALATLMCMWTNGLTTVYSTPLIKAVHADAPSGRGEGFRFAVRLLVANSLVFVALAILAYVFLPVIAAVLFPGFVSGLETARLLIVSMYYRNISALGLFVVTAQNKFNVYLFGLAGLVIMLLPLVWWLAPRGIVWVAVLAVTRRIVDAHIVLHIGVRSAFARPATYWAFCVGLYGLGLLPLAAGWLVDLTDYGITRQNVLQFSPQIVVTFGVLVLGILGTLYALHRRFRVLSVLWQL